MGMLTDWKQSLKDWGRNLVGGRLKRARLADQQRLTIVADREYHVLHSAGRAPGPEVCYFSSFDRDSMVDEHVFRLLAAWKDVSIDVVFVSTSARISDSDQERLKGLCHTVILRKNLGYDFLSWKVGYRVVAPVNARTVFFMNDSCYGPLSSWSAFLDRVRAHPADIVGVTDSWQIAYHLQSYFLAFQNRALGTGFLDRWVAGIEVISDKRLLIRSLEIGLSQDALKAGLSCAAVYDYRDLLAKEFSGKDLTQERAQTHFLNSCYQFWNTLVAKHKAPLLKVALLRDNPDFLVGPGELDAVWEKGRVAYPLEVVLNHQKRISAGNVP